MSGKAHVLRLMLALILCHSFQIVMAQVVTQDSLSLVALYDSTDGAGWTNNTNWLSGEPVSSWYGISVSSDSITGINLYNNNLIGEIPVEIGNLYYVTNLNLGRNQLSGEIPDTIWHLTNLTNLTLSRNQFTGNISERAGELSDLTFLSLENNQFTGNIPDALGNLTDLLVLNLSRNQLTGIIPDALGNLADLKILYLYYNQLSGNIPDTLGALSNLTALSLLGNQLTGPIPNSVGNLTNLTTLSLSNNQLTGPIPDTLGNLSGLTYLSIEKNHLTGSIPASIGNLSSLIALYFGENQLSGSIPVEIANMSSLSSLFLNGNQLTGAVPPVFTNLTNLSDLGIENNRLDDLPDLSGLTNLSWLVIQNNRFTFEDIEPNIGIASQSFTYSPQDSVGEGMDTTIANGEYLEVSVAAGGTANQYQWMKDELDIPDATSNMYIISSAQETDDGVYICKITNSIATDLTLYSRVSRVRVNIPQGLVDSPGGIPEKFALSQNYPNPFNPRTRIKFDLPEAEHVTVTIHNVLGQEIATALDERRAAGYHAIDFDAGGMVSGVYFYIIKAGEFNDVRKMVLVR